MTGKGRSVFMPFFIWLGIGFLIGLTGSVIAAPMYAPSMNTEVKMVYAPGLEPRSQPDGGKTGTSNNTKGSFHDEEIFLQKGCIQCHEVSFYGISGGVTGPDLSKAYYNVPARYGKTLEHFLQEPEGQMTEMFTKLTIVDEEKALILDLLTKAAGETTGEPIDEIQSIND